MRSKHALTCSNQLFQDFEQYPYALLQDTTKILPQELLAPVQLLLGSSSSRASYHSAPSGAAPCWSTCRNPFLPMHACILHACITLCTTINPVVVVQRENNLLS